jgi:hypothetical protein
MQQLSNTKKPRHEEQLLSRHNYINRYSQRFGVLLTTLIGRFLTNQNAPFSRPVGRLFLTTAKNFASWLVGARPVKTLCSRSDWSNRNALFSFWLVRFLTNQNAPFSRPVGRLFLTTAKNFASWLVGARPIKTLCSPDRSEGWFWRPLRTPHPDWSVPDQSKRFVWQLESTLRPDWSIPDQSKRFVIPTNRKAPFWRPRRTQRPNWSVPDLKLVGPRPRND